MEKIINAAVRVLHLNNNPGVVLESHFPLNARWQSVSTNLLYPFIAAVALAQHFWLPMLLLNL
jgi:hypothetical protein